MEPDILAELARINDRLDKGAEKMQAINDRLSELAFAGKETAKAAKQICERLGHTVQRVDAIEQARAAEAVASQVRAAEARGRASVGAVITRRQIAAHAGIVTAAVGVGGALLQVLEAAR